MNKVLVGVLFFVISVGFISAQDDPNTEDIIIENSISHSKSLRHHHVDNVVIIPGDDASRGADSNNPFKRDDHYEINESIEDQTLHYKTKNLNLKVAEDGATINGEFHEWRRKNSSWGIFDRAREAQISFTGQSAVVLSITVDWKRPVWQSAGQDTLRLSKSEVRTSEEVSKSIFNFGNDFESGVLKLDSADKVNKLVNLINPYLAKPYTKRLVLLDNLGPKERVIETIITQAEALHGQSAENEFLRQKFIENYWIGFSADDLIRIASVAHGQSAENEILYIGARAYLYYYNEEDIRKVAKASHGQSAENQILMLLARKGAGTGEGPVVAVEGYTEADIRRSRFISELIDVANRTSNSSASDEILIQGFKNNLQRNFSVLDVIRISRSINNTNSKDNLILLSAEYYKHRWSQDEFQVLTSAVSSSSVSDRITTIAASQIGKPRRSGAFYDSGNGGDVNYGLGLQNSSSNLNMNFEGDADVSIEIRN